jgi:hypothetical protein
MNTKLGVSLLLGGIYFGFALIFYLILAYAA